MYCGGKESPNEVRLTNTQGNAFTRFLKIDWNAGHEDPGAPINLWISDSPYSLDQSRYSFSTNRMKLFQPRHNLGYENFLEPNEGGFFGKFSLDFSLDVQQFRKSIPWPIEIIVPGAKILIGFDFLNKYPSEKSLPTMEWKEREFDDNLSPGVAKQFKIPF